MISGSITTAKPITTGPFSAGQPPGDSTYPGPPLVTRETWSTYSAVVQASWLLTTDTSNPRLLTDARFLGSF
jgi:hypothetical protein